MAWWRTKESGQEHARRDSDDSGDRDALGARERVVRAAARGVTDAVLDRIVVQPWMVERVKRWFK
jgi:hypothetical protein